MEGSEVKVCAKGYDPLGRRTYLVGRKGPAFKVEEWSDKKAEVSEEAWEEANSAYIDLVNVTLKNVIVNDEKTTKFVCSIHGLDCEHVDSIGPYLDTVRNLKIEVAPRPRKVNWKLEESKGKVVDKTGAAQGGLDRTYFTTV